MDPNLKDLFNQFHEFQDLHNLIIESNAMFEVAPPSFRANQQIEQALQGQNKKFIRENSPFRDGNSSGRGPKKPQSVGAPMTALPMKKRIRGGLKPLDPITGLLSVSACFSPSENRNTAHAGPRG